MATNTLSLFPARIKIVNPDGTMTPEFYRALQVIVARLGGPLGDNGGDVYVTQQDFTGLQAGSEVSAQMFADPVATAGDQAIADMAIQLQQPSAGFMSEMTFQGES